MRGRERGWLGGVMGMLIKYRRIRLVMRENKERAKDYSATSSAS